VSIHYYRFTRRGADSPQRAPLLERLLARADTSTVVTDWRADAFRVIAPRSAMPGVGAAALCAEQGSVDAASVFIATPVHYLAEMSNVRLAAHGILSLSRAEADALAADFNRVWHDAGFRLVSGRSQTLRAPDLFCVTDRVLDAVTRDPEEVLDRHIQDYLPAGPDAPRLRRLMSEIEMWLFEHAVNRTRLADAAPAVNGLWLWGGGPALASLPPVEGWTAGEDPFVTAFGTRPELPSAANPVTGAQAVSGAAAAQGVAGTSRAVPASGVVVIDAEPGTDAWRDAESRWLGRSFADLRAGRIARLDLSAGDRCYSLRGRWNWRPWRRRRPWWEFFQ
jgi:hypothetical protein